MSSIEAGIPTANEFLSLTDLDIDGGESDDDLQKCELPKHTPMNMNMDCYLNSRFSFAVMGVAPLKKWEEEHTEVPSTLNIPVHLLTACTRTELSLLQTSTRKSCSF